MPLYEARERFTISEMVMISWRSQEQYWKMKQKMGNRTNKPREKILSKEKKIETRTTAKGKRIQYNDQIVDSMPDEFFNEEGELDMRLMTGVQAVKYLNVKSKEMGLPLFPMIGGLGRGHSGPNVVE